MKTDLHSLTNITAPASRFVLSALVAAGGLFAVAQSAQAAQQGVTRVVCRTDHAYIYKYARVVASERQETMVRGTAFRVYHYPDSAWAFGVHNSTGVSGYVLRSQLCVP